MKLHNTVYTVTRLWGGWPRDLGSIPCGSGRIFIFQIFQSLCPLSLLSERCRGLIPRNERGSGVKLTLKCMDLHVHFPKQLKLNIRLCTITPTVTIHNSLRHNFMHVRE